MFNEQLNEVGSLLRESKRPLIILGAGANSRTTRLHSQELVKSLNLPVLTTWGAKDLIPHDNPNLIGTFGSHGTRYGNFAVQNADLVIVIGSRLSSRETGGDLQTWAREARIIHIDIDNAESDKFKLLGRDLSLKINTDLKDFLPLLTKFAKVNLSDCSFPMWFKWIEERKLKYRYDLSNKTEKIIFLIF
jgi:acetolactate synthase-1/2/3 large subunit